MGLEALINILNKLAVFMPTVAVAGVWRGRGGEGGGKKCCVVKGFVIVNDILTGTKMGEKKKTEEETLCRWVGDSVFFLGEEEENL